MPELETKSYAGKYQQADNPMRATQPLRLVVADDHEVVRKGLRAVLEARPGWEVAAEAKDGKEAVQRVKELKPDVTVLDISMPLLNGLEATRQIIKDDPK